MPNTGNVFVGTGENNAGTGATAWTNPGNITSDNATDATCNAPATSQYLVGRNADLSTIPDDAVIGGVLVRGEASEHSGGTEAVGAQLQGADGALIGTRKSAANEGNISGTTKAVYTWGSTTDLWGATLTPAIVKDPDFGVRFNFLTAHDVRFDYVTIAVEYTVPRRGIVGWAELEVPTAPRRGQVGWAELEVPTAPRRGLVGWAELEVPDVPVTDRRGQISWAELEVPTAPRRADIGWAELEVPDAPRRAAVSWAELEIPTAPRRALVGWAELETPTAPRRAIVGWSELEIPTAPRRAIIGWAELEAPFAPRRAVVGFAEFETPDVPAALDRRALVTWAEMEVPFAPRRAVIGWSELEVPTAPRRAVVGWGELEIPTAPRRGVIGWCELEVPDIPGADDRRAFLSWAEFQVPAITVPPVERPPSQVRIVGRVAQVGIILPLAHTVVTMRTTRAVIQPDKE